MPRCFGFTKALRLLKKNVGSRARKVNEAALQSALFDGMKTLKYMNINCGQAQK